MAINETASELRPPQTITRFFLSSPAYFVGEAATSDFLLTLAMSHGPSSLAGVFHPDAHARHFFVLSISHEEWKREGVVAPDYTGYATMIADVSSVWYGKQIDFHGEFEGLGFFQMPDLRTDLLSSPRMGPYSNIVRPDLVNKLDFGSVVPLLTATLSSSKNLRPFLLASHYYNRALQSYNRDVEVGYLQLVAALEILASAMEFSHDDLFGEDLRSAFEQIGAFPNGDEILRIIKPRLYQLRRRIALMGRTLAADRLFEGSEAVRDHAPLERASLENALKSAYDVRSRHLHAGTRFGHHIVPLANVQNELQLGKPVLRNDPAMEKALSTAPTFLGLERITRFFILRYFQINIAPIHQALA